MGHHSGEPEVRGFVTGRMRNQGASDAVEITLCKATYASATLASIQTTNAMRLPLPVYWGEQEPDGLYKRVVVRLSGSSEACEAVYKMPYSAAIRREE